MKTNKGEIFLYNDVAYFKPDPNVSISVQELQDILNEVESFQHLHELDQWDE